MRSVLLLFVIMFSFNAVGQNENRNEDGSFNLTEVDLLPSFPGGATPRGSFIRKHLSISFDNESCNRKLFEGKKMKTYVVFDVNIDGSLTNISLLRSSGVDCIDEACIQVVKEMPRFVPGRKGGVSVKVNQVILPILLGF
jgi:TonB family protein